MWCLGNYLLWCGGESFTILPGQHEKLSQLFFVFQLHTYVRDRKHACPTCFSSSSEGLHVKSGFLTGLKKKKILRRRNALCPSATRIESRTPAVRNVRNDPPGCYPLLVVVVPRDLRRNDQDTEKTGDFNQSICLYSDIFILIGARLVFLWIKPGNPAACASLTTDWTNTGSKSGQLMWVQSVVREAHIAGWHRHVIEWEPRGSSL